MKVIKLLATLLLVATMTSLMADENVKKPFESVKIVDGRIEAVLPPSGSHWVAITGDGVKTATQHEKFSLGNGEELQLVERHIH